MIGPGVMLAAMSPPGSASWSDRLLIVASLAGLAALVVLWGTALAIYGRLPDRFPTHFGASGRPDHWEVRSLGAWLVLPAIGTLVVALMVAAAWFCRWAALRKPQLVNIPFKDRFLAASPGRRAWIVEPIAAALALDAIMIAGLFLFLIVGTERVANGAWTELAPAGPAILVPLLVVVPLAGVGWTSWRAGQA